MSNVTARKQQSLMSVEYFSWNWYLTREELIIVHDNLEWVSELWRDSWRREMSLEKWWMTGELRFEKWWGESAESEDEI